MATGVLSTALSLGFLALLPGTLSGQTGVTATLSAGADLVKMGPIRLTLTVDVAEDAEVDAAVLGGMNLEVSVDGEPLTTLSEGRGGTRARVAAGTRITRRIPVDLEQIGVQARTGELTSVSFVWPGLNGASALVKVAPDVSGIDVADLDLGKTRVVLSTSAGDLTLAFYPDKAPNHVRNFIELARSGFYDGTAFHRVIPGFMVQGGCPNTREGATGRPGTGGPGWTVDAEFNDVNHVRGILSMARSTDPDSAGSQFFIVHGQASHLDGQYTAFGVLESGFDTLDRIAAGQPGADGQTPLDPVRLHYAVVLPITKS